MFLQIQHIKLAGRAHVVIDVALVHDFSGECWRDVHQNGQLHYADTDMLLNNATNAEVRKYREKDGVYIGLFLLGLYHKAQENNRF